MKRLVEIFYFEPSATVVMPDTGKRCVCPCDCGVPLWNSDPEVIYCMECCDPARAHIHPAHEALQENADLLPYVHLDSYNHPTPALKEM